MDKNLFYRDLADSADADKHFNKTVMPFTDTLCDEYVLLLKQLEAEGKITLEEYKVQESQWDRLLRMKGYII